MGDIVAAKDDGGTDRIDNADELDDYLTLITCKDQMTYIDGVGRGMSNKAIAAGAGVHKNKIVALQKQVEDTVASPVKNPNGRAHSANYMSRTEARNRFKARKATA